MEFTRPGRSSDRGGQSEIRGPQLNRVTASVLRRARLTINN